ncbi:hypothetical protein GXW82_00750 [Streptacidiphilus sp. 4-A2]|nr:hypothetical protein [Streptacidiphilus sp. 4-A2]
MTAGVAVLAAMGGGYLYIQDLDSNIHSDPLHADPGVRVAAPKPNAAGQTPLNILMIGSDTRDTTADCDLGGSCSPSAAHADVEMLVHVSADRSNISVLSIPRDTTVQIANCDGHQGTTTLITDSLNYGPGCTVDTWEKLTGIDISAYMMIDFSGVVNMSDAVGGVQVCTKENVQDPRDRTSNCPPERTPSRVSRPWSGCGPGTPSATAPTSAVPRRSTSTSTR